MLKIGDPAPDFELPNQDGKMVRLSDYRGQKVVLFAYPRANTPGCTKQACGFRDNYPSVQAKNAVVLGISTDQPADQLKWKQEQNLPFDLLCDTDHKVLEVYGGWGEKVNYGKKSFGTIRSHWVIDENGNLEDIQLKVTPENSVAKGVAIIVGSA